MLDNPNEFHSIISTVRQLAVADGYEQLLELLNNSEITIKQSGYDNWNGGQYFYTVCFQVEVNKFIEIKENLQAWEDILKEQFSFPIRDLDDEEITRIVIVPKSSIKKTPEANPSRPLSAAEQKKIKQLNDFLENLSEDDLINEVLMPLFRHLGFYRITITGHKDKALEYGKDIWMKYELPTKHLLYFGVQVKKDKLDSAGLSKGSNTNIAEIKNQTLMMLGHEIFDPDIGKKVLVDHAFIIAGGDITKQAKNWLAGQIDASKRRQIIFMDREEILNLYVVNSIPLPLGAVVDEKPSPDDLPF